MKQLRVRYRKSASNDLAEIGFYLEAAGAARPIVLGHLAKLRAACSRIGLSPEGRRKRDDLIPGLRMWTFERRAVITYQIDDLGVQDREHLPPRARRRGLLRARSCNRSASMNIDGRPTRTIRLGADGATVEVLDQTRLPHEVAVASLRSLEEAAGAIRDMVVRGAPLIGVTAAYGLALAMREDASDEGLGRAVAALAATRPTAVNLRWALDRAAGLLRRPEVNDRVAAAYRIAAEMADEDVATCRAIGEHGAALIRDAHVRTGRRVNVLTHCNAGWLAAVDWGTALAPVYVAHDAGVPLHVWVDETRPRNQGAALTAFELGQHGVPHTIVADNAGGHLMQHGEVDLCIVGSDRTTATGDVANKIGTYLKALAAHDNGVPFYAALPASTIDWSLADGVRDIPIEQRSAREVTHVTGRSEAGEIVTVEISAPGSEAANPAFDVTPARLVTGIITERGVAAASRDGLAALFPRPAPGAR